MAQKKIHDTPSSRVMAYRKRRMEGMKRVEIWLSDDELINLDAIAVQIGVSRARVVGQLLAERSGSLLSLVTDTQLVTATTTPVVIAPPIPMDPPPPVVVAPPIPMDPPPPVVVAPPIPMDPPPPVVVAPPIPMDPPPPVVVAPPIPMDPPPPVVVAPPIPMAPPPPVVVAPTRPVVLGKNQAHTRLQRGKLVFLANLKNV